jgi:hypothetical protein
MAAISAVNARQHGDFVAAKATLTSSDTITFDDRFNQLLVFENDTGGSLTLNIDGDGQTSVKAPGLGSVSVGSGYAITCTAGQIKAVRLSTIREFCRGTVTLTGASGGKLTVFNL